jgi:hypothetical protein
MKSNINLIRHYSFIKQNFNQSAKANLKPLKRCVFWIYIHTYHSRFIPEGVAEASQIFLRDAHVLPKSQSSILGISAINTLVAFYDIHGRKREVLFFYFVPDITRDYTLCEYTSCYFKVVTLFVNNLFRVRLPYLLLIRSLCPSSGDINRLMMMMI